MQNELSTLEELSELLTQDGQAMVMALVILIIGLFVARLADKGFRASLRRLFPTLPWVTTVCNIVYVAMVAIIIMAAAVEFGAKPVNMLRLLTIITLVVVGSMIFLRPFIPSLPFKVGQTIKAGDLLGKVEAITLLNTRLRTFDGKTFFVPNRQVLNDIVINYHITETRRVKIDVGIRYDQDLIKAKQVLEAVMVEDPRVKAKPGPAVYTLDLTSSSVNIGGRCWVNNKDYWVARCDLIEKTKLRFDNEGIEFAFPQLDLHINSVPTALKVADVAAA
jgi:small conductance mechanosensitive channel